MEKPARCNVPEARHLVPAHRHAHVLQPAHAREERQRLDTARVTRRGLQARPAQNLPAHAALGVPHLELAPGRRGDKVRRVVHKGAGEDVAFVRRAMMRDVAARSGMAHPAVLEERDPLVPARCDDVLGHRTLAAHDACTQSRYLSPYWALGHHVCIHHQAAQSAGEVQRHEAQGACWGC